MLSRRGDWAGVGRLVAVSLFYQLSVKQVITISANLSDSRVTTVRVSVALTQPARVTNQFRSMVGSEVGKVEVVIRSSRTRSFCPTRFPVPRICSKNREYEFAVRACSSSNEVPLGKGGSGLCGRRKQISVQEYSQEAGHRMYRNNIQEQRRERTEARNEEPPQNARVGGGREIGSIVGVVDHIHRILLIQSLRKPIVVVEIIKTTLHLLCRIQWTVLKEKDDNIPSTTRHLQ